MTENTVIHKKKFKRKDKNKAMKVNISSVDEAKELFEGKFPQETWKQTKKNVY